MCIYNYSRFRAEQSKESHEGVRHSIGRNLLLAEDLDAVFNGLLDLLASLALGATEDKLGNQAPVSRQVPLLGDRGVKKGVVVLQVGAETNGLESSPD